MERGGRYRSCIRRGFSLLELVIVLAIVGAMASIALPRFNNSLDRTRIDAAARQIMLDMTLAQRQARTSNLNQTVKFFTTSDKYMRLNVPDSKRPTYDYEVMLRNEPYLVNLSSASFGIDSDIIFDIYGVPDDGGTIVITNDTQSRTITVDADSGQASLP